MLEVAAALCAGLGVMAAILSLVAPAPSPLEGEGVAPSWLHNRLRAIWAHEQSLVVGAGLAALGTGRLALLQLLAAIAAGIAVGLITGLPALSLAGAVGVVALVRGSVASRSRARQVIRQDAVLDSVRMLRQLLETGASSLHSALAVLGERGPRPLRSEFRAIAATSVGRRQAWISARERVGEPLFDMLAAAVLVQGPGGGELGPLFADLETSVSGAQEVEREARALQVQARSAATIIVTLPIAFLVVLSALHSPYLDAYLTPLGQAFLLAMLWVMGGTYLWMRRLLALPGLHGVRLGDA